MGRLEDIVERNKHPAKHRRGRFPWGLAVASFVFLILVLMIFTDLDESPRDATAPAGSASPGTGSEPASDQKRVRGVGIYVDKPRVARDAGSD
jgi:hypothetical protein